MKIVSGSTMIVRWWPELAFDEGANENRAKRSYKDCETEPTTVE